MPVTVDWDDAEQTIICFFCVGVWRWPHFEEAWDQANAMIATVEAEVYIVVDISRSGLIPANAIASFRRLVSTRPRQPNAGDVVIVGADRFIELMWRTLAAYATFDFEVDFAPDLASARKYIRDRRGSSGSQ
jgi:hypothetical protein